MCALSGPSIKPRPQDGVVVAKTASKPTASSARYLCVAWQAPHVKSVEFEVTTRDGGIYARVVAARSKRADVRPHDLGAVANSAGQTAVELCTAPTSNVVEEEAAGA